ncbi:MAG: MFS transporter [Deltaproteobacteria bacterium]|nr:MFS transporter [Deltaproteobacteria bacterium]
MKPLPWWREPTRAQWVSFTAAWLGWVLDAFDFTIFLLVMPEISKEFGATQTMTAGIITLTLLVRLAGGYFAGIAADRWGRKLPLMLSLLWFAVCDGAIAFAGSFTTVMVLRTLFGFGMGAEWTAGTTLAMENWPKRSRGIASGILQGSWAVGYLLAGLVSSWVVPAYGWRALFICAAAPALLVLPIRIWVPESEEWKARRGAKTTRAPLPGFSAPILKRMAWASLVMALGFGGYYGLTGMYPTMLKTELGLSAVETGHIVALFNIGMMIGAVACGIAASKKSITLAIVVPALAVLPVLPLYVGQSAEHIALGALLGGAFGAGYSGVTPILLTSLFPAEVRARAIGVVYHVGAFGAAFVPIGIAALAENTGASLALSIAGVVAACEIALIALLATGRLEAEVSDAPRIAASGSEREVAG